MSELDEDVVPIGLGLGLGLGLGEGVEVSLAVLGAVSPPPPPAKAVRAVTEKIRSAIATPITVILFDDRMVQ